MLKETCTTAKPPAEIEVYENAAHGWCPPDSGVYNEPQAEKAWARLLALYLNGAGRQASHGPGLLHSASVPPPFSTG